jgi:hypothetical protein
MRSEWIAVALCACAFILVANNASGQGLTANPAAADSEEDRLAREVDDPTAILTQLKLQDEYTPENFKTPAQTNEINLKLVVPIEPLPFLPFKQIIRPTFKVQTLAVSQSNSSTITEFTDMELLDLFLSNWPDPKTTGFGWGIGPTFVFPTGRVPEAGDHAWQAGPAAAAAYRGVPHLMLGFIPEPHLVRIHKLRGDSSKPIPVSAVHFIQPWPWQLREVGGLDVEGQLAPRHFDYNSDQPGLREGLEAGGV